MGCSYVYSGSGESLQYRLTHINNPVYHYGKPHMSKEDARRTGESIRELFFATKKKLPGREVIHKRSPFMADERGGLLQGVAGVTNVDMIEINVDAAFRYVASIPTKGESFQGAKFPVKRGTVVVLDANTSLLWNHGDAPAVNPNRHYYQGKRRIPAPLLLRRHVGKALLKTIAREILGLSKMH